MTTEFNPFRPPEAPVGQPAGDTAPLPVAGKGRRFGTFVVDYIGFYLATLVVTIPLVIAFGIEWLESLSRGKSFLLGVVVMVAYYLFFEGLWGRTPGKLVFGTRVVAADGSPMTRDALMKRTLARLVPFEAFTFFGSQGFHDKVSRTRVVRVR